MASAAFRFLHRWVALIPGGVAGYEADDHGHPSSLAPIVNLLEDRDRELEDYLAGQAMDAMQVLDVTNTVAGSAPVAPFAGMRLQAGTNVAVPAGGFITIAFDTPFPNGVVSVVGCFGDSPGVSNFWVTNITLSDFRFYSGAAVGLRVNWLAIGW